MGRKSNETKPKHVPATQKPFPHPYWMPVVLLALGCISLAMLVWTNRVNARERRVWRVCDAVMDIRIATGIFHLRTEEVIYRDTPVDPSGAFDSIDQAIRLAEAVMHGGKNEHGQPVQQVEDPDVRKRLESLHSSLVVFKRSGEQRLKDRDLPQTSLSLNQRFHEIHKEIQENAGSLEADLESDHVRSKARAEKLFAGVILAWALVVVGATGGLWNRETRRRQAEEALERANNYLGIEVEKRTRELRNVNDQLRRELDERRKAEDELRKSGKQLGYLSSQLLSAQEKERKRLAAELHDELGGALGLLRIEFTLIDGGLTEDQKDLKDRCRRNLHYLAQVADDVSRISRNLSPYLLEDLGLSAALRSLVDDFTARLGVRVTSDIPEIDGLFPPNIEIAIYRILQESLTNIAKHAGARHVSMAIETDDDSACFIIEDDGRGFDVHQALHKEPHERGMGLATMSERVGIMGGSLDIWSREGRGSRITLRIPRRMGGVLS